MTTNELSAKETALVGIGAAIAAGCRPCLQSFLRAARAAGACERSIRLAIETGLYAGTSATRSMAAWAEAEQGAAPELDAAFRTDKERMTALVLAGASMAASSFELLARYVRDAEALDWSNGQLDAALATARTVSKTAAAKVESFAVRMGFSLGGEFSDCCPPPRTEAAKDEEPAASGGCGCGKGEGCA